MSRHGNKAFEAFKTPWSETYPGLLRANGYFHAEHGLADKWYPHQESIRVPLIVHDPRMPSNRSGLKNDQLTLNADLAPTILAAANIAAPARMQGRDLSPLHNDANLIRRRNWGKVFRSFGIFGGLCLLVHRFSRNFQKFA